MKNIKIDTNYIPPSDESIDAALDFDALLKRNEQHKAKYVFSFRPYAVAASVALAFMAVSVMAYIIIRQQKENYLPTVEIEKKQAKDVVKKKATIPLEPQWYVVDNSQDQYVETKAGKIISFSAKSFRNTKSNKILVSISEITNSNYMKTHFNNGTEAIYLYAVELENKTEVELRKPLTCSFMIDKNKKTAAKIWYKKDYLTYDAWELSKSKGNQLLKVDKIMLDYQSYIEAKQLLDSINKSYTIENGVFVSQQGINITYTKKYVAKLKAFVSKHENSNSFAQKLEKAQMQWQNYVDQRDITVRVATPETFDFEMDKMGWWVVK